MSNVVEIVIKAVDQASGTINKSVSGLDKFKSGFQSLTGFSLGAAGAVSIAGAAIGKIVDYTKKAVTETVDYNSSIIDMARVLGLTTEETSRLVQASDDLFISQEKLNTALLAATRQGIDVSIVGLQRLSEEYLSLGKGTERSEFLIKTFGRSGADMGKLMEVGADGIASAIDSISDSLVVTREAAAATIEYKQALDSLNDSFEGIKIAVGNEVMPKITAFNQLIIDFINGNKKASQAAADFLNELFKGTDMESDYSRTNDAWADRLQGLADEYFRLHPVVEKAQLVIGNFADKVVDLNNINPTFGSALVTQFENLKFDEAGGGPLQKLSASVTDLMEKGFSSIDVEPLIQQMFIGQQAIAIEAGQTSAYAAKAAITQTLGMTWDEADGQLKAWLADIPGMTAKLNMEIGFNEFVASDNVQHLPFAVQQLLERPGESQMAAIKVDADTALASQKLGELTAEIGKIKDKTVTITVNTNFSGSVGSLEKSLGVDLNDNDIIGRAGGGPIVGNTPYLVGERGPEIIVPGRSGTVIPNDKLGGNNVTFYGDAYFAVEKELTIQDIMKQMRVEV